MIYVIFILGYFGGKRKVDTKKLHTYMEKFRPQLLTLISLKSNQLINQLWFARLVFINHATQQYWPKINCKK